MHSVKANRSGLLRVIIILCALVFLYLPIFTLIVYSFNESRMVTVWTGVSLKWYHELFNDAAIGKAVGISLLLAFMTASTSVVIGTLAAFVLVRVRSFRGESLFLLLITAPMVLPEVITGLALLLIFVTLGEGISFFADRGIMALWVSHVTFCTAYATVVIRSRFRELDISIEEAAMDLGAGPVKVFFAIILPAVMPAEIAAFLLSFTMSLDDLVITSFIAGPDSTTLPMLIFSSVRRGLSPEINALATIIVLIVSIFTFFAWLSMVKKEKRRKNDEAKAKASAKAEEALIHSDVHKVSLSDEELSLLKAQAEKVREGIDTAAETADLLSRLKKAEEKSEESESVSTEIKAADTGAVKDGEISFSSSTAGVIPEAAEHSAAHRKEQLKSAAVKSLGETAKEATKTASMQDLGQKKAKVLDRSDEEKQQTENTKRPGGNEKIKPKATTASSIEEAKYKATVRAAGLNQGKTATGTTATSLADARNKGAERSAKAASSTSAIAATRAGSELAKNAAGQAKVVDDTGE